MMYVVAHNPIGTQQAGFVYGPFLTYTAAQRFAESCEANGLVAATRRLIAVDDKGNTDI